MECGARTSARRYRRHDGTDAARHPVPGIGWQSCPARGGAHSGNLRLRLTHPLGGSHEAKHRSHPHHPCRQPAAAQDLLDLMKAKLSGEAYDRPAYDARVQPAVAEMRAQAGRQRHRRRHRRRNLEGRLLHLCQGAAGRASSRGRTRSTTLFAAERGGLSRILRGLFQAGDAGRRRSRRSCRCCCVGPVRLCRRRTPCARTSTTSRRRVDGVPTCRRLRARDGAERRRLQRLLQERRGISFARRRGAAQRIPRHRRRRLPAAGRRSVPVRHLRRPEPRRRAEAQEGATCYVEAVNHALRGIARSASASTPATASTKARASTKPR